MSVLTKIFGDPNVKMLKELRAEAEKVNVLEPETEKLSDDQLREKTVEFKKRVENGETLDDIIYEAFAVIRETAKRTLGQRHYDVQLIGGFVLHRGSIAEMRTGEGKTLTSTLAIYLNALSGKGVHIVTVNDYLAKRDAVWMGQIFEFHGLSIGVIQQDGGFVYDASFKADAQDDADRDETGAFKVEMDFLRPAERADAYNADVTYGTNNQFGFDYLRDNMAPNADRMVQRELSYAVIDEIDSILIDESRTPLIVSAPAEESADLYVKFARLVIGLKVDEDYNVDEKMRVATFTDDGLEKVEKKLGVDNLYAEGGLEMIHHAEQALKAHAIFRKDKDYVVQEGEVKIVDEFTGRIMEGRRYSEGLHQAIEAKEGVPIKRESRTLATITFQNLFRMYDKLSGMTGTAATEAEEFGKIYDLDVVEIPTNKPIARADGADRVYKNEKAKMNAVVQDVKALQQKGQPVLIGTASIEKNELVSQFLKKAGVKHELLNAKAHEREGQIIAQAGRLGAVTVATNMAGRGVDIVLGGNPSTPEEQDAVKALGGLHVAGTERHESRRIDNQLRGRSGRQGDPGSTQFYVSLEDDLMRIFGGERVGKVMETLRVDESVPIESKIITKSLEKSQSRVEGRHFDTRKHLLEYDDVLNKHRIAIYDRRRALVKDEDMDVRAEILKMVEEEVERVVLFHTEVEKPDVPAQFQESGVEGQTSKVESPDWDPKEIVETLATIMPMDEALGASVRQAMPELTKDKEHLAAMRTDVIETFMKSAGEKIEKLEDAFEDKDRLKKLERTLLMRAIDNMWVQHLDTMRYLRRSIGLRGYGQRDPLVEYKREAFGYYNNLSASIDREVVYNIFKVLENAVKMQQVAALAPSIIERARLQFAGAAKTMAPRRAAAQVAAKTSSGSVTVKNVQQAQAPIEVDKQGRNEPCSCGAVKSDGTPKKYKHCHGKNS